MSDKDWCLDNWNAAIDALPDRQGDLFVTLCQRGDYKKARALVKSPNPATAPIFEPFHNYEVETPDGEILKFQFIGEVAAYFNCYNAQVSAAVRKQGGLMPILHPGYKIKRLSDARISTKGTIYNSEGRSFPTARAAAEAYGLNKNTILSAISRNHKSRNGLNWFRQPTSATASAPDQSANSQLDKY
jgi:hypothetical protein